MTKSEARKILGPLRFTRPPPTKEEFEKMRPLWESNTERELREVKHIGQICIKRLRDHARQNGWPPCGSNPVPRYALVEDRPSIAPMMAEVIERSLAGETLKSIGASYRLSRERTRQIRCGGMHRVFIYLEVTPPPPGPVVRFADQRKALGDNAIRQAIKEMSEPHSHERVK